MSIHHRTASPMSRLHVFAVAALLGSAVACNPFGPGVTARTIVVHHHPVECMAPWEQLCLLMKAPGELEFTRHSGGIEGFQYDWGYVSELEVIDRRVLNPPADGSSIETILRRVISSERVPGGTEFDIILTSEFGLAWVSENLYRVYGHADIVCHLGSACDDFRAEVASGARMRLRLEHPTDPASPLILREWATCTTGSPGSSACTS